MNARTPGRPPPRPPAPGGLSESQRSDNAPRGTARSGCVDSVADDGRGSTRRVVAVVGGPGRAPTRGRRHRAQVGTRGAEGCGGHPGPGDALVGTPQPNGCLWCVTLFYFLSRLGKAPQSFLRSGIMSSLNIVRVSNTNILNPCAGVNFL